MEQMSVIVDAIEMGSTCEHGAQLNNEQYINFPLHARTLFLNLMKKK